MPAPFFLHAATLRDVNPARTAPSTPSVSPPHAPERGWTHRLLGRFHVTGIFWYRFHAWAAATLPSALLAPIVWVSTSAFFVVLIRIRRALGDNLDPVLGRAGLITRQIRIFRSMHNFAWCLTERYERLNTSRSFRIDIDIERWRRQFCGGEGFILITAHIGNYEVGSMLPAVEEGRTVIVVREQEVDADAQQFVKEMLDRAGGGRWTNHFESDDAFHGMALLQALREGAIIGIQGDRPRQGGRNLEAKIFGMPFQLPSGPASLARTAETALVPAFVFRRGRRHYEVELGEPIRVARTRDRDRDVAEAMQQVALAIEAAIRRAPYQWFCFRRLWS